MKNELKLKEIPKHEEIVLLPIKRSDLGQMLESLQSRQEEWANNEPDYTPAECDEEERKAIADDLQRIINHGYDYLLERKKYK